MSQRRFMRRVMQLGCIFLLLFAQQTALTHAIWHYGGGEQHAHAEHGHIHDAHAHNDGHAHEGGFQSELCVYHIALGEALGIGVGTAALPPQVDASSATDFLPPAGRSKAEAITAVSRGPPILL